MLRLMSELTRRSLIYGTSAALAALGLSGCITDSRSSVAARAPAPKPLPPEPLGRPTAAEYAVMYGPIKDDHFAVPAVVISRINPIFLRQNVAYRTKEIPGTIIVDPRHHFLYRVLEGGRAIRYGIGVGLQGLAWAGDALVKSKDNWPNWYPTKETIKRRPELKKELSQLKGGLGVPGGPSNPLGARIMYLSQGRADQPYRIHGTDDPMSIGRSVSFGCIGLINQDAIDLAARTPLGTKVVVLGRPRRRHVG